MTKDYTAITLLFENCAYATIKADLIEHLQITHIQSHLYQHNQSNQISESLVAKSLYIRFKNQADKDFTPDDLFSDFYDDDYSLFKRLHGQDSTEYCDVSGIEIHYADGTSVTIHPPYEGDGDNDLTNYAQKADYIESKDDEKPPFYLSINKLNDTRKSKT